MKGNGRTKKQLIAEVAELQKCIIQFEASKSYEYTLEMIKGMQPDFPDFVENANDLIQSVDPGGHFTYVNKSWMDTLGYSEDEVSSLTLFDIIHPDNQAHCMEMFQRVIAGETVRQIVANFVTKTGDRITVEGTANCRFEDGKPLYTRGIFRNITEHKLVETLRESNEYLDRILNGMFDVLMVIDSNYKIVSVNNRFVDCYNQSREELVGKHCYEITHSFSAPCSNKGHECPMNEVIKTGSPCRIQHTHKDKEGNDLNIEIYSFPLRNSSGDVEFIVEVQHDITDRKRAEEQLRESEDKYRLLIDNLSEAVVVVQDGMIKFANPSTSHMTGYSSEELTSKPFKDFIHPEESDLMVERYMKRLRGEEIKREHTFRGIHRNGEIKWFNSSSVSITWESRPAVLTFLNDITEQIRANSELLALNGASRAVLTSKDFLSASRRIFDYCREVTGATVGYIALLNEEEDTNEVLFLESGGMPCSVDPSLPMPIRGLRAEAYKTGKSVYKNKFGDTEYGKLLPSGHVKLINVLFSPLIVDGKSVGVMGLANKDGDFTEKDAKIVNSLAEICSIALINNRQLELLQRSEENYKAVVETAAEGIFIADVESDRRVYANPAACKMFGYTPEEFTRLKINDIHPDESIKQVRADIEAQMRGKKILSTDIPCIRKDGTVFYANVTGIPVNIGGKMYGLGFFTDITATKQAESAKRELEQKALLSSHLASIGEMASGVAHEINNPLTGVIGFSELLMNKDIPEDIKGDVKVIHEGAQRVADIVKNLLAFSRQQKPERTLVNINHILENALSLRAYTLKSNNVEVSIQLDTDLPVIIADGGQLLQVFLNIIINAEAEMKNAHGGGELTLKTEQQNGTIIISFKDDGPGIAKKNLNKIFDPFFTTREIGQGTGLGLSVCHGIITEHNGRIYARSQKGEGATFIVELPIPLKQEQLELSRPLVKEVTKRVKANILVVDDEPVVRDLLSKMLSNKGHKVDTVDSAEYALESINNNSYDLILLDIKMPDMSGDQLYNKLKKISPSLTNKILFITGDVMGADTISFIDKTRAKYITKPFDIYQLEKSVNEILSHN